MESRACLFTESVDFLGAHCARDDFAEVVPLAAGIPRSEEGVLPAVLASAEPACSVTCGSCCGAEAVDARACAASSCGARSSEAVCGARASCAPSAGAVSPSETSWRDVHASCVCTCCGGVVLVPSAFALSASGPASASFGAAVSGFGCEAAGTASAVPAGGAQEPSLPAKLCRADGIGGLLAKPGRTLVPSPEASGAIGAVGCVVAGTAPVGCQAAMRRRCSR